MPKNKTFEVQLGGETWNKRDLAGQRLLALQRRGANRQERVGVGVPIGQYGPFAIHAHRGDDTDRAGFHITMHDAGGAAVARIQSRPGEDFAPDGMMSRLDNALHKLNQTANWHRRQAETHREALSGVLSRQNEVWPHTQALEQVKAEFAALQAKQRERQKASAPSADAGASESASSEPVHAQ